MKGKFSKTEMRGLPGGPNQQFTYVTGVFMQDMYHAPIAQKGGEGKDDYKNYVYPLGDNTYQATPYALPVAEVWGNPINRGKQLAKDIAGATGYIGENILQSMASPEALAAYMIDKSRGKDTEFMDVLPEVVSYAMGRKHKGQPDVVTSSTSPEWVKNNPGTAAILPLFFPGFGGKKKAAKNLSDIDSSKISELLNELDDLSMRVDKDLDEIWKAGANQDLDAISNIYNNINQRWIDNIKNQADNYVNKVQNDSYIQELSETVDYFDKTLGAKYRKKERNAHINKIYNRKKEILIEEGYNPNMSIEDARKIEDDILNKYYDLNKYNEDVIFDTAKEKFVADPTGHSWNRDKFFSTGDRALQESKDKFEEYFKNKNLLEQKKLGEGALNPSSQLKLFNEIYEDVIQNYPNWTKEVDKTIEIAKKRYHDILDKQTKAADNVIKNQPAYDDIEQEVLDYIMNLKRKGGEGYRINAPDYDASYKVIPSGNITMTEQDGGPLKKGPLLGIDNMGNQQMMFPGYEYVFPGDMVMEIPVAQKGLEGLVVESEDDPRYQLYKDSLRHYNAMMYMSQHFGGPINPEIPITQEDKKFFYGDGTTGDPNESVWSTPLFASKKYQDKIQRHNHLNFPKKPYIPPAIRTSDAQSLEDYRNYEYFDPNSYKVLKYYESLGFKPSEIGYYNSADLLTNDPGKIQPIGYWQGKEALNPYYKKPEFPVSVKGQKPLEILGEKKEPQPSYRIHDFFKHHDLNPSFKSRSEAAKAYGIENYKGTEEQNKKLIELMLPNYPLDKKLMPRAQKGGEFQRLVNKYTTKGWQSLTDEEKQTYKEMYQQYK